MDVNTTNGADYVDLGKGSTYHSKLESKVDQVQTNYYIRSQLDNRLWNNLDLCIPQPHIKWRSACDLGNIGVHRPTVKERIDQLLEKLARA